jgi:hypothetical protein
VRLRLRFRSQSSYPRVKAEFHNPFGWVIKLEGVSHPREESGAAHTEVVLTSRVPECAALGTYDRTLVEGLTSDRKWATSSKTQRSTSAWSNDPSTPKEGKSFWDSSLHGGGKLNLPAPWPLTTPCASLVIHPTT